MVKKKLRESACLKEVSSIVKKLAPFQLNPVQLTQKIRHEIYPSRLVARGQLPKVDLKLNSCHLIFRELRRLFVEVKQTYQLLRDVNYWPLVGLSRF